RVYSSQWTRSAQRRENRQGKESQEKIPSKFGASAQPLAKDARGKEGISKWNDWSYQREGDTPCFCVSRGNKGLTGEWPASRGNKGVSARKSEEKTKRMVKVVRGADRGGFCNRARACLCQVFTTHDTTLFTICQ